MQGPVKHRPITAAVSSAFWFHGGVCRLSSGYFSRRCFPATWPAAYPLATGPAGGQTGRDRLQAEAPSPPGIFRLTLCKIGQCHTRAEIEGPPFLVGTGITQA